MLSSSPVMAAPDYRMPFKLAMDASDVGSGAVLFQEDKNGLDHLVHLKRQVNYSTIENGHGTSSETLSN